MSIRRSDIIPILYMPGTGGNFLGSFLYHAREGSNVWKFSKHGNTHNTGRDPMGSINGPDSAAIDHINSIYQLPVNNTINYVPTHCANPSLALLYFDKIIKTYFTINDVNEIHLAFMAKRGDDFRMSLVQLKQIFEFEETSLSLYDSKYKLLTEYLGSGDNVLNISWTEILHADPAILITKLSTFTNLPVDRFPLTALLTWRTLTIQSIREYKN